MLVALQARVRSAIRDTVAKLYQLDPASLPAIIIETPPRRALGDMAVPLAFELARRLRKAPRAIAQDVVGTLGPIDGVLRAEAAPNGYINVFLDRATFVRRVLSASDADSSSTSTAESSILRAKTIVEHTAINPNKAAHVGHLRNATMGDTMVRLLRFCGVPVEVQNYIDDTGVQVADVVVGFRELEGKTLDEIRHLADTTRFDYYCWDLYARVGEWYAADNAHLATRSAALQAIEHGGNDTAAIAAFIADRIVRAHLQTMGRLNVDYDLLTWEGDILRLKFWATAFDILKQSGAMFKQEQGKLAGCWVMVIDEDPGAEPAAEEEAEEEERREKVIVRSDGTVTYVGKDIALQFWKFGLLGKDFHYRRFSTGLDGNPVWATTTNPTSDEEQAGRPAFGHASVTYNIIDTRQSYLQKLLKQALATLGHVKEAERAIHFAYEMVVLTHRTARELGYTDIDESRPFVEVSGRKGLGVKVDDLLDRLIEKAHAEVQRRNPDMPPEVSRRTAEQIAVAAIRYFLVKFTRTKLIAFDIDEALSFEGESGPYLQYSTVRAQNIFQKLREREGLSEDALIARLQDTPPTPLLDGDEGDELWNLALEAARLDEVVEQAVRTLEPSVVAKYAFALSQAFNALYHKYPVLNEERADWRIWRAAVISFYRRQLTRALDLMGAQVPTRM
jgi:arginyl-tRNA synthetase